LTLEHVVHHDGAALDHPAKLVAIDHLGRPLLAVGTNQA
jgi:hypothetical protein